MQTPLVWLLSYTAPVAKSMQVFNSLTYFAVPAWPSKRKLPTWLGIEVGFLSGRLYFEFFEYEALLVWLGRLLDGKKQHASGHEPFQLLQEWVTYRRQTDDILYTPVGFVCQRQRLHEGHFFFRSHERKPAGLPNVSLDEARPEETDEDDGVDDTELAQDSATLQRRDGDAAVQTVAFRPRPVAT
jgi:hypothetical protein